MSRSHAYHSDRLLTFVCSGEINPERARFSVRQACVQASEMGYSLLFDLRETTPGLSFQDAIEILGESANLWKWVHRVALVGDGPEMLEWLRFVAGVAVNAGVMARVFEGQAEGRAWAVAAITDPLKKLSREDLTVLVVDDDPDILELTSHALRGGGFNVLSAESGEACMEIARRELPDLILLDVAMPDPDGLEVCRRLKAEPDLSRTYVALVSGVRTNLDDQAFGLAAGADGFIPRPAGRQEIVARVEILLLRREADLKAGL